MRGTKTIKTGDFMKKSIRFKYFKLFFGYISKYVIIDGGVSVKQMCTDLDVGRNIVIRVLKQAEKEEMITRSRIPETNIELINLTDKGKEWIRD